MVNWGHSCPITRSEGAKTFVTRLYVSKQVFRQIRREDHVSYLTLSNGHGIMAYSTYHSCLSRRAGARQPMRVGGGQPDLFCVDEINRTNDAWQPNVLYHPAPQPHLKNPL